MENVFNDMQVGIWSIEIGKDNVPRMYGDEIFLELVEAKKNMSPEELYNSWFSSIKEEYLGYINNAIERIVSKKQVVEVEYVWRNGKNQETFVRCCGKLDEKFKDGLRIKGYHQNIDKIINLDIKNDKNYEVKDYFKFLRYAAFFYELYDECYEIDLETHKIVTIFNKKNKYVPINENNFIFDETNNHIHPEDRSIFNSLFNCERIKSLEENSQSENMDIRIKNIQGKYTWVRLKALVTTFAGKKKLVFYLYDIEDEKKLEEITREKDDIVGALVDIDSAIMDINLESEDMKILKFSKELNKNIKINTNIVSLREKLLKYFIQENDIKEVREFFSIDNLRMLADKKIDRSIEVRLKDDVGQYKWVRIYNLSLSSTSDRIFILMKNINENYLSQNIIEKFVYNN